MKRSVLIITLTSVFLFLASLGMIAYTLGWIAPLDIITTNHVVVGDLDYTLSGSFITDETIIVPGTELIDTPFAVDNDSSIPSMLRMQVTYTTYAYVGEVLTPSITIYRGGSTEALYVGFASGFVCPEGEDYWYMTDLTHVFSADSGSQDLVLSLYYDGENTTIDFQGQDVTVKLTIQVSQSDHVNWTTLANYDFATGYPNP